MPDAVAWLGVLIVMIAVVTGVTRRRRGSGGGVGSAAAGAFYDLLQEDKRKAIEIIVEDRAAARDPERAEDKNTDSCRTEDS
jgi:hypothetical protein